MRGAGSATLAAILQAAIDERFDRELYDQVLEEETETRLGVLARLHGDRD